MVDQTTTWVKECSRCKITLSRADFGVRSGAPDGLQNWCRECHRQYQNEWSVIPESVRKQRRLDQAKQRVEEREYLRQLEKEQRRREREATRVARPRYAPPAEKACTKCGVVKLLELFGPHQETRDKKNSWCRECLRALRAEYQGRESVREKRRQYKAAARRAAGVPPRPHDAHVAAYRAHLKELARQRRAEAVLHDAHVRALTRHLKKLSNQPPRDPPGKNHRRKLKHRTGGTRQMPPWANPQTIKEVYLAARLLTEMTGIPHDVDHIVPLKHPLVSGLHVESNLWPVPRDVNNRKSNKYWPDMPSPVDSASF